MSHHCPKSYANGCNPLYIYSNKIYYFQFQLRYHWNSWYLLCWAKSTDFWYWTWFMLIPPRAFPLKYTDWWSFDVFIWTPLSWYQTVDTFRPQTRRWVSTKTMLLFLAHFELIQWWCHVSLQTRMSKSSPISAALSNHKLPLWRNS